MYRTGKLIAQLIWVWVLVWRHFDLRGDCIKSLRIPGGFTFTMVETRGIEPLTS